SCNPRSRCSPSAPRTSPPTWQRQTSRTSCILRASTRSRTRSRRPRSRATPSRMRRRADPVFPFPILNPGRLRAAFFIWRTDMAASTYDEALRRLLAHEGGYTNHPSDPGGPTNFGITIYDYRKYVKPNATAADMRAMTVGEAKAIYRKRYWDAQRCDELPAGVDYSVFDYGVNSGIGRSGKV